jgi:hypothetical protein
MKREFTMSTKLILGAALGAVILTGASAVAQTAPASSPYERAGTNEAPKGTSTTATPAERLKTSGDLVAIARETKDPLAMITAARIRASVATTDKERTKVESGSPKDTTKTAGAALTVDQILAEATALAKGDKVILAMIADVKASASKGRVGGPGRSTTVVRANAVDSFTETFRGAERAAVYVEGDGDTDLDLFVYDENGNMVCSDTDGTDRMICAWTPRWTGNFTIRVRNWGGVYNQYSIVTN